MLTKGAFSRGDTLIEVLLAIAVFGLVVVAALTVMNQGTSASQRSVDISLVRQEIDGQAEALRFMRDSYISAYRPGITFLATDLSPAAEWSRMIGRIQANPRTATSAFGVTSQTCTTPSGYRFILDARRAKFIDNPGSFISATTYAKTSYRADGTFENAQGLWIEAVRSPLGTGNTGYVDFHIRACWPGSGLNVAATQGTIVRLYEPRS